MTDPDAEVIGLLTEGKGVKIFLSKEAGSIPLYLVPSLAIEGETEIGLLIALHGKGAIFYDGKKKLIGLDLLRHGFTPLDCARVQKIFQQIFPNWLFNTPASEAQNQPLALIEPQITSDKTDKYHVKTRHTEGPRPRNTIRPEPKPKRKRKPSARRKPHSEASSDGGRSGGSRSKSGTRIAGKKGKVRKRKRIQLLLQQG